ncbi:hypothetical protein HY989_03865 [Candidatus Micrarchaeota archaeon]|nr:hypothetical protein [Candidatus Micrarchaeota archaeon]
MRAQLFSFDLILSVSILLLLFGITVSIFSRTDAVMKENAIEKEISQNGNYALSSLIETSGYPTNWEQLAFTDSNAKALGLATSAGHLNPQKVGKFFELANSNENNYLLTKRILGIDFPSSNYTLEIYDLEGEKVYSTTFASNNAIANSYSIYAFQRLALLNNQPVRLSLRIWVKK